MDMGNDGELRLLADAMQRFACEHAPSGAVSDGAGMAWSGMRELGLAGAVLSEADGGSGLGSSGAAVIAQALGRTAVPLHYCVEGVFLPLLLVAAGERELLNELLEGRIRLAVGASLLDGVPDERGASPMAFGPPDSGAVLFLDAAANGPALILRTGAFTPKRMADGRAAITGFAQGHEEARVLSAGERVEQALAVAKTAALAAASADMLGAMGVLFEQTLEYMRMRNQFGQPLARFQTIQFRLVDMSIRLEEARALSAAAASAIDERRTDAGRLARAAWVQALWSGREIAQEAVQLHGGIGMTAECAIAPLVKRVLVNELIFGQAERHMADYRALSA